MDFDGILSSRAAEDVKGALAKFLHEICNPAFGALPKSEMELLLLNLLENIGAVSDDASDYELVSKLRVTNSRARKLIYERELRRLSHDDLDSRVKDLLRRPIIQKSGELFILEIGSPLVSDHLRARVRELGFFTDGSFSPSVVKLPLDAIVALMEFYIPKSEQIAVRRAMIAAGAPDTSFKGVLKAVLGKVAQRVASETGEAVMQKASEYLGPIIDAAAGQVTAKLAEVFE